jgi:hypothetical protein
LRRVPRLIFVLFACNVALIAAPVLDMAAGRPFSRLSRFLYLDAETTLQAWYSSMLWFVAAVFFGLVATHAHFSRLRGALAVALFAAACLAFSIDEIAGVHEWLGQKSDALLPGGDRTNTALARTGIWPLLIGIPVVVLLAAICLRARSIFEPRAPRAFQLLTIGLVLMFTGALAVEMLLNLLERPATYSAIHLLQHASEEFLEMLGASVVVWSGLKLLKAYGFELKVPEPAHSTRKHDSETRETRGHPLNWSAEKPEDTH